MFRTENSVGVLKSIATIAGLAIILWSLGLPSLRFADAASVTSFSDVISDSAPSAAANHTITYTIPTGSAGVEAGETIVVNFPAGFAMGAVAFGDVDLSIGGADQTLAVATAAGVWGVAVVGQDMTFTSTDTTASADDEVIITIGTNATGGANQIGNSSSEGSYDVVVTSGTGANNDSGTTKIVILTAVTVTASVETIFTFSVAGTAAGTELSAGGDTTTGAAASTSVTFGELDALAASSSAHLLTVSTNASVGYNVTVQIDGALESSTGADIDGVAGGDVPAAWSSPTSPTLGVDETYGWWGISSDDTSILSRGTQFVAGQFIAASTTPRSVMGNNGPVNGVGVGVGTTTIGFQVEISALQEAGDDYSTILTYVATPTF